MSNSLTLYNYTCQIIALLIHCDEAMKIQKSLRWSDEFAMKKKDNFKLIFLQKKPKFLWKVVISWISEPWNKKNAPL